MLNKTFVSRQTNIDSLKAMVPEERLIDQSMGGALIKYWNKTL